MSRGTLALLALSCVVGCSSRLVSNTPRTAIEQMLLTAAVDKALAKLDLPEVRDKKVFLDFTNLKAYEAEYTKVAVRARFGEIGAILAEKAESADMVAEVASGAMGTEFKSSVLGLPALPVPNSPVPFPEAYGYKSSERTGIVKLLIFLHEKGRFVATNQYFAKADRHESFLLWWRFQRKDDIREGWERADLKLKEETEEAPAELK
jgi:hypothetical protein